MMSSSQDEAALQALELRLRTILPEEYQDTYEEVQPVSMGSAVLKYRRDGKVAWDDIWESFCDLAMAGGPPHKGMLLEPASAEEIAAKSERYADVVAEICRGITLVSGLPATAAPLPGWVRVDCGSFGMAEWLVRAIVMENVSARCEGDTLDLPAGPNYRVEKEIKNVVTVIAKTCHYWIDHMWQSQQRDIAGLFAKMNAESPLVQPALASQKIRTGAQQALCGRIVDTVRESTGLQPSAHRYANWVGLECPNVRSAIWMMRALVVSNVLARRELKTLFLPVNAETDPGGAIVAREFAQIHTFARARGVL